MPYPQHSRRFPLRQETSLSGIRVARELDALIIGRDKPLMMVSNNGTEPTSMTILRWSQDRPYAERATGWQGNDKELAGRGFSMKPPSTLSR